MLIFATIIGIYSYVVFFLGITGLFYLIPYSLLVFALVAILLLKKLKSIDLKNKYSLIEKATLLIIFLLLIVNLIGALSPELAFDALWYHLTIPKIFIDEGRIFYIPGNLFYYSLMPKLTEMLFIPMLMVGDEILTKMVHFAFGILAAFALFKLLRFNLSREYSLIGVAVFLSSLVVSWLMTTAYSDLSRAFYEILALLCFIQYDRTNRKRYLVISAVMLGFAVSVKLVSLGTVLVFILLLFLKFKASITFFKNTLSFVTIALIVPTPWFVYSYMHSGNPIYPLFSKLGFHNFTLDLFNPLNFVETLFTTFLYSADPINPIFIMAIPLIFLKSKSFLLRHRVLIVYSIATYIVWYFFFQAGGSRFLTSYFGGYTLLLMLLITGEKKKTKNLYIVLLFVIAIVTIFYRGAANSRALPYIFGYQSKEEFLMKRLNFSFGDFYDEGGSIKKIVGNNLVVLHNMHNIFYVDFYYTLPEWSNAEKAKYALVQNGELVNAQLIYQNKKTNVKLYELW